MDTLQTIAAGVGVVLLIVVLIFAGAALWTWVIMLAMGAVAHSTDNLQWAWGFWQVFPIGLVVSLIIGAITRSD